MKAIIIMQAGGIAVAVGWGHVFPPLPIMVSLGVAAIYAIGHVILANRWMLR